MNQKFFEERYSRQARLPGFGEAGQRRLACARIAVVGAGGLASPLLLALAGAGIGHITLVDSDQVSISNLNRQFLYGPDDVGESKVRRASSRLKQYRPDLSISAHAVMLTDENAVELLAGHDLVAAAVDNLPTRYVINRATCHLRLPMADAAVKSFQGYAVLFEPGKTACYECFQGLENSDLPNRSLYGNRCQNGQTDESAEAARAIDQRNPSAVSGTIPAVLGSIQATMIVNQLLDLSLIDAGTLVYYNGLSHQTEHLALKRHQSCRACSDL